jgi:hypothetical protein
LRRLRRPTISTAPIEYLRTTRVCAGRPASTRPWRDADPGRGRRGVRRTRIARSHEQLDHADVDRGYRRRGAGRLGDHERRPSGKLFDEEGGALITIRLALELLATEGLVASTLGRGTFVGPNARSSARSPGLRATDQRSAGVTRKRIHSGARPHLWPRLAMRGNA